ncbi:hypothetical protein ACHQM5_013617 [Ranunculus cassubicifolius]
MPKNTGKGGKNRRRGKNEEDDETKNKEIIYKEEGQEYGQVTQMLGNGILEAKCIDGVTRVCHIRGKMHKKVWIASGDIILVGLRDYQDEKADVIHKYTTEAARSLIEDGQLPRHIRINEGIVDDEEEDTSMYVEFKDGVLDIEAI